MSSGVSKTVKVKYDWVWSSKAPSDWSIKSNIVNFLCSPGLFRHPTDVQPEDTAVRETDGLTAGTAGT